MRLPVFVLSCARVATFGIPAVFGFGTVGAKAAADVDLTKLTAVVGRWEMSLDDTERRCEMTFRSNFVSPGYALAMPAGCRRAMPILADVRSWKAVAPTRLDFDDGTGAPVIEFTPVSGSTLAAKGPEGETYELIASSAADAGSDVYQLAQQTPADVPSEDVAAARRAAAAPPAVPKSISDVAGRYSLLREGNKDTGCLLTLETTAIGRSRMRAILAPACRDQGLLIFDPVGWQVDKGNRITLTARKGQQTHLDLQPDGTWSKEAKDGTPLILKRV